MKKIIIIISVVCFCIIAFSSCADAEHVKECTKGDPCGFFSGLWHGIIAPISFIISLFCDSVAVYAVNNNGGWYDFGFLLGIGAFSSGATKTASK